MLVNLDQVLELGVHDDVDGLGQGLREVDFQPQISVIYKLREGSIPRFVRSKIKRHQAITSDVVAVGDLYPMILEQFSRCLEER